MRPFSAIPFFRISLPFITGILLAIQFELQIANWTYLLLLFIPLTFLNFYPLAKRSFKRLFMLSADLFLILFGLMLVQLKDQRNQNNFYGNYLQHDTSQAFIAVIKDLPLEKDKFIKCEMALLYLKKDSLYLPVQGSTLVYFKKSLSAKALQSGQKLFIKAPFFEIEHPKNPYEFNYKRYLQYKQIYHSAFVDSTAFSVLGDFNDLNPLWSLGVICKSAILKTLKNSTLSSEAYAICAALLTGYDDDIDKTVIDAFAHSGTLHVLSVSGLHTGLIYLVLNFLLDVFDKKRKYKLSRFIFITVCLWFFALLSGFSAPVLRAVIMFNFLGAGKLFFRNHFKNQINILFVSAFLLLSYDPFYIKDIGFLLSYFALFGILYFQPKLAELWHSENGSLNYLWQSVTVSFAATISTLPITLFYFKQFPLWFFVCNVFVVPATFLLLLLALLVLVKFNFIGVVINYIVSALIYLIKLFDDENIGFIDRIHFTESDVFFLSVLIVLLSASIELRSFKYLRISFICLIVWQCYALFESFQIKQKQLFTVYQINKHSTLSVKNKTRVYVNDSDSVSYTYSVKPHLISFNYPIIEKAEFNLIKGKTETILLLKKESEWPQTSLNEITSLVISNNCTLTEQDLRTLPDLKKIIVDGSNNKFSALAAEKLSRKFGIDFYNTKQSGAYLQSLQ